MATDQEILDVGSQELHGVASSLTKYLMVTNFRKKPRGLGFFLCWNDMEWPLSFLLWSLCTNAYNMRMRNYVIKFFQGYSCTGTWHFGTYISAISRVLSSWCGSYS